MTGVKEGMKREFEERQKEITVHISTVDAEG